MTRDEKGVEAEAEGRAKLTAAYEQFMAADGSENELGKELIHAIFGTDAIAEDPLLLTCHRQEQLPQPLGLIGANPDPVGIAGRTTAFAGFPTG